MLQKLSDEYLDKNLILERFRHKESRLEADLNKNGIYVINPDPFPLAAHETSYMLGFIDKWNELSFSLPGFYIDSSNSIDGITRISYYPSSSDKVESSLMGHDAFKKYIQRK